MNSPINVFAACFLNEFFICDFPSESEISVPVKTRENGKGLISIRNNNHDIVIAYPNINLGYVNVLTKNKSSTTLVLNCHRNEIDMLDLSLDCSLLVTASTNGRNIKIFDILNGGKLL
jgi:hypothetical protein